MMNRRSFLKKIVLLLCLIPFLGFLKEKVGNNEEAARKLAESFMRTKELKGANILSNSYSYNPKDWRSIYGKYGKNLIS